MSTSTDKKEQVDREMVEQFKQVASECTTGFADLAKFRKHVGTSIYYCQTSYPDIPHTKRDLSVTPTPYTCVVIRRRTNTPYLEVVIGSFRLPELLGILGHTRELEARQHEIIIQLADFRQELWDREYHSGRFEEPLFPTEYDRLRIGHLRKSVREGIKELGIIQEELDELHWTETHANNGNARK